MHHSGRPRPLKHQTNLRRTLPCSAELLVTISFTTLTPGGDHGDAVLHSHLPPAVPPHVCAEEESFNQRLEEEIRLKTYQRKSSRLLKFELHCRNKFIIANKPFGFLHVPFYSAP